MDKVIYTDIDSTLNDHWRRIRRNTLPQWPGTKIDPKAFSREEIMKDLPLDGAVDVLQELAEKYPIVYLTARAFQNALPITQEWLKKYEFPEGEIVPCQTLSNKPHILRGRPAGVVIDDFLKGQELAVPKFCRDVAERIQAIGFQVIVFRNDWMDVHEILRGHYGVH